MRSEAKVLYGFNFKDDALVAERSEAKVLCFVVVVALGFIIK